MRTFTTLLIAFTCFFAACAHTAPTGMGQSVAMKDDAGIIALTWDGETARAYRAGREIGQAPAETWDAALWSMDLPAIGEPRALHHYTRMLSARELSQLETCDWAETRAPMDCGIDARCDCDSGFNPAMASL